MFEGFKCSERYLNRFKPLDEFPKDFQEKILTLASQDKVDWMLLHRGGIQKIRTKHYNVDDVERYLGSINENLL